MGVLSMLELEGDTESLLGACEDLDRRLPEPDGLLVRIVAPTDEGIVLFQLWESADARQRHAENSTHLEALETSGMMRLATSRRSRVFEGAMLSQARVPDAK